MKNLFLSLVLCLFLFTCGCALIDKIFGTEKATESVNQNIQTEDVSASITGVINVPAGGALKVSDKISPAIRYRIQSEARVYLIPDETLLKDCRPNAIFPSVFTNASGQYRFTGLTRGSRYKLVVDLPPVDGIGDDLKTGIIAAENLDMGSHFIREKNLDPQVILQVTLDKLNYIHGETLNISVTGYLGVAKDVHVEIYNEMESGTYIWSSPVENLGPGDVTKIFTRVIPSEWPATKSTAGADYKVYAAIGDDLKGSDDFNLLGKQEADKSCWDVLVWDQEVYGD